jgi:hypothetical protein
MQTLKVGVFTYIEIAESVKCICDRLISDEMTKEQRDGLLNSVADCMDEIIAMADGKEVVTRDSR